MIVLDTDHLSEFQWARSPASAALRDRLRRTDEPVATTIVSVEEQARGWLAEIHRKRKARDQITPYRKFQELFAFFAGWTNLSWTDAAVDQFDQLKAQRFASGHWISRLHPLCSVTTRIGHAQSERFRAGSGTAN